MLTAQSWTNYRNEILKRLKSGLNNWFLRTTKSRVWSENTGQSVQIFILSLKCFISFIKIEKTKMTRHVSKLVFLDFWFNFELMFNGMPIILWHQLLGGDILLISSLLKISSVISCRSFWVCQSRILQAVLVSLRIFDAGPKWWFFAQYGSLAVSQARGSTRREAKTPTALRKWPCSRIILDASQ